jgi:phage shock protein C
MICYHCQREIAEGSRYCYLCGAAQKPHSPSSSLRKPLRRSRRNKMIAGVCGGFAEHFDLDVSLVRILWVLVALFGGGGILAYVICWIVIPLEELPAPAPVPAAQPGSTAG